MKDAYNHPNVGSSRRFQILHLRGRITDVSSLLLCYHDILMPRTLISALHAIRRQSRTLRLSLDLITNSDMLMLLKQGSSSLRTAQIVSVSRLRSKGHFCRNGQTFRSEVAAYKFSINYLQGVSRHGQYFRMIWDLTSMPLARIGIWGVFTGMTTIWTAWKTNWVLMWLFFQAGNFSLKCL